MSAPRFYSQHGEDRWIYENLKPEPGFFIDIGAFNGVNCSNTLGFEDLGWSGICVEPDPIMASQCTMARKCQTLCAAVGMSLTNPTTFAVHSQDRGLSGLRQKWDKTILVPVLTLEALILCCPNLKCDLLSIDTEGSELEVWHSGRGMFPRIVIMEYQTREEPSNEEATRKRMTQDGYACVHKTPHNLVFARL